MTSGDVTRAALKHSCLRQLEARAIEHPAGHQGQFAARYLLRSASGEVIDLMFEKGPRTPANLWLLHAFAKNIWDAGIAARYSPGALLYQQKDATGKLKYGRHSALKPMRQLANADLVCLTIRHEAEIEDLLARLAAI